ncbi:PilX N-terminal domain-containing pilus assembly protein [Alishewanella tabrizica]|uniref:MSHA biogenesis protein MshP n=1 Tax=Alishewanella tabrizica TaxID=671278 RepID=A0ABQ2WBQ0_9ALTE|nr:PilX N-terminal domain-containing pilus assembly protein [Alishewanella tabrizica]GGW48586.1 MSHA biogenesis protein MshP [Alishewanella tabrizica]
MCPNFARQQRGSALVIAIFIIVVMLALVVSLSRLLLSSSESLVYEVQGTRAFFAAQSGLELALTEVFPRAGSSVCNNNVFTFDDPGLRGCEVRISCQQQTLPANSVANNMYQLTSLGRCEADGFITSRTISMEVRE